MTKEQPTTVRLLPDTKTALKAFARAENRTVSNAIEALIEEGLKRRRYLTATGQLGKLSVQQNGTE